MARIRLTGPAQTVRSHTRIKVAKVFLIQKSAAVLLLLETLLFPVHRLLSTRVHPAFRMTVLFQRLRIDRDRPPRAAGILTLRSNTPEFFIIMRICIQHSRPLFLADNFSHFCPIISSSHSKYNRPGKLSKWLSGPYSYNNNYFNISP